MSKDMILGNVTFGPNTRTVVRIKSDGTDVTSIPSDKKLMDASLLSEVTKALSDLTTELATINPNRHPVKYEVIQRWANVLTACADKLNGVQEMPNATG